MNTPQTLSNSYPFHVFIDFREENWPSMELVPKQLVIHLRKNPQWRMDPQTIQPNFFHLATRLFKTTPQAWNIDRLFNRFFVYPNQIPNIEPNGIFHVSDHSYAHLLNFLPPERSGVFCHDLDTFRCLLSPNTDPRPLWFRSMAQHILKGFQKASIVFHTTDFVGNEITKYGLIPPHKLVKAPLGVADEFFETTDVDRRQWALPAKAPYLVHLGSCIPRKRIDRLLRIFAKFHSSHPDFFLLQVGGQWSQKDQQLIEKLGLGSKCYQVRNLERSSISALLRGASATLLTSDSEGFGIPLIEALATGTATFATDIAVLREVGGKVTTFCSQSDENQWVQCLEKSIKQGSSEIEVSRRKKWAHQYQWKNHAKIIAEAYQTLVLKREKLAV